VATKRDLVEAHAFSRRRLVTAFVSGAPGGREVEPARPGRTIVGGMALGVLLVAGAAITGIFTDDPATDWDEPGLVISKEQGAAYVILDEGSSGEDDMTDGTGSSAGPLLRPVLNITSAHLILGAEGLEPRIVSQETIETRPLGEDIGILDAPARLAGVGALVETGWSACTSDGLGIRTRLGESPGVTAAPGTAFLVKVATRSPSDPAYWVVATAERTGQETEAYRYALTMPGRSQRNAFLAALDLPLLDSATKVPGEWLALLPRGADLDAGGFDVPGLGDPLPGGGGRVGDYVVDEGGGGYLVTADGAELLDEFALQVLAASELPGGRLPRELAELPSGSDGSSLVAANRWPEDVLDDEPGEHCVLLEATPGEAPRAQVAVDPVDGAAAAGLDADEREIEVEPGGGAYVMSGGWGDVESDSRWAVDQKGRANALVGAETPTLLGYGGYAPVLVPDAWLELFETGVALSQEAALCPPDRDPGSGEGCA
jgi:hypothetical protein